MSALQLGSWGWRGEGGEEGGTWGELGSYYEPTEWQPIGLTRLPAPNNGEVKGRKEGRKRKGVQLAGSTCVLRSRRDESKTIKNVSRRLIKWLGVVAISKVTR